MDAATGIYLGKFDGPAAAARSLKASSVDFDATKQLIWKYLQKIKASSELQVALVAEQKQLQAVQESQDSVTLATKVTGERFPQFSAEFAGAAASACSVGGADACALALLVM